VYGWLTVALPVNSFVANVSYILYIVPITVISFLYWVSSNILFLVSVIAAMNGVVRYGLFLHGMP
jgi:hypothetical protein